MGTMKFKERLSVHYGELTPTDKRITKFVIDQPTKLMNKTVQLVADEIEVSPAAMIRYVKKLGYRGFPEFVLAMEAYSQELNSEQNGE
jgi:DNA-binding MurR/RpiR family transcriptional regulator